MVCFCSAVACFQTRFRPRWFAGTY
uniref:Uncharacterized protein n=1 Tax=Rhizophora mucronata TaxID=61149 RepID=A0A2P2QIW4_RHIMU